MVQALAAGQQLTELQADALREVANVGAGNAVTALAEMTGQPFNMSVPRVGLSALDATAKTVCAPEDVAAAVYMPVDGDAPGHAAFLYPYPCACGLADLLLGLPGGTTQDLGEMECSALTEAGNILVGSFLRALSEMTGLSFPATPPGIAVDMAAAILQCLAAASPDLGDHAITILTRLEDAVVPVRGVFMFIPEPSALPVIFHALGIEG